MKILILLFFCYAIDAIGQTVVRPFVNAIPIPGRNVPILRLFENYAASCRPKNKKDFSIDQLATLLQSLQMDEVASKVYNSLFFSMSDMQIDRFMGRWYTVVDSKKFILNLARFCIVINMLTQTEFTSTFTIRQYSLSSGENKNIITNEGFGRQTGTEPGEILINFGHPNDQCPYFPVKLGGLDSTGNYEYIILSTPLKYPTMVLTRNLTKFDEKYRGEVYDFVEKYGFMSPLAALDTRLDFENLKMCMKINALYENGEIH
ncbi:unnamed protein product [Caenorhabditis angaria]|uniref:Lipocalin domain-containing protein n=1 Tax=Caenorhabditis angaria TaxID=860376 RepID=A0A9P1I7D1_9PELO|nr:unnamed protein product [Caenorhabditis angaria]